MREVLPHSADAERALIGSLLKANGCGKPSGEGALDRARAIIRDADAFFMPSTRTIWTLLCDFADEGLPLDDASLAKRGYDEAARRKLKDDVQWCVESVATWHRSDEFAEDVAALYQRRLAINEAHAAMTAAFDGTGDVGELLAGAAERVKSATVAVGVPWRSPMQIATENPELAPALIDGLARAGEVAVIVGGAKSMKSWAAADLAVGFAASGRWLGNFAVTPGRVLVVDTELRPATFQKRLAAVASARGYGLADLSERLAVWNTRGTGIDIDGVVHRIITAREHFDCIVVDAIYKLYPPKFDENSNADWGRLFVSLDRLAEKTGALVAFVHHSSKGNQSTRSAIDVGSGAGTLGRSPDCHIAMRQHADDGVFVVDATLRSFPPTATFCVQWTYPTLNVSAEHDPAALRNPNAKPKTAPDTAARRLADFAETFGDHPQTREQARDRARMLGIDLSDRAFKARLAEAVAEGMVTEHRPGGNRPNTYTRIRSTQGVSDAA